MALSAESISFRYAPSRALVLSELSTNFRPGRITVIAGPNGAGKSTLVRLLAGVREPTSGRVLLDDRPVRAMPARERAGRLAYVAQRSDTVFAFTARQVVAMGRYAVGPSPSAVEASLTAMRAESLANEPLGALSVGQQQRVALARAMAQLESAPPEGAWLLADEPLSAMDPSHALQTIAALRERAAGGMGIILVLHDLTFALRFADDVVLVSPEGRVAAQGPASDVLRHDVLAPCFGVAFERAAGPSTAAIVPIAPAP